MGWGLNLNLIREALVAPNTPAPAGPTPDQLHRLEMEARRRRSFTLIVLGLAAAFIAAGAGLGGAAAVAAIDGNIQRFRESFLDGFAFGLLAALPGLLWGVYRVARESARGEVLGHSDALRVRGILYWVTFPPALAAAGAGVASGVGEPPRFDFIVLAASLTVGVLVWYAVHRVAYRAR